MQRIKYLVENGNSGILNLGGAGVTISGRSKASTFLTPALKTQLENTARVKVTAITESKSKKPKPAAKEPKRRTGWPAGSKPKPKAKAKPQEAEPPHRRGE